MVLLTFSKHKKAMNSCDIKIELLEFKSGTNEAFEDVKIPAKICAIKTEQI
jgi:hypothetical protein